MASHTTGRARVRFRGGPLDGALLDLPPRVADPKPGQLTVTAGGIVFDRHRKLAIQDAVVVEFPRGHRLRRDR